jgi:hypothetical protein
MTLGSFISGLDATFLWHVFKGLRTEKAGGQQGQCRRVMSLYRYKEITMAIRFMDVAAPTLKRDGYVDRFLEVHNMLDVFNEYYTSNYHPSWLNVHDESMSSWLRKFCPGFICVPRKPHQFGNK